MDETDVIQLINKLESFFKAKKEILFCYVFGSFTDGSFNAKSDVDVAVFLDKAKCNDFFEKRLELIAQLSRLLKKEVDVIILNTANSPFFKYVIIKEGKMIFTRFENKRIDFELRTINEYFDFKPVLEKYYQRILSS